MLWIVSEIFLRAVNSETNELESYTKQKLKIKRENIPNYHLSQLSKCLFSNVIIVACDGHMSVMDKQNQKLSREI